MTLRPRAHAVSLALLFTACAAGPTLAPLAPAPSTATGAPAPSTVSSAANVAPTPPVARREPHVTTIHDRTIVDDYDWLRKKGAPDVVAYLEAENAYAEAAT